MSSLPVYLFNMDSVLFIDTHILHRVIINSLTSTYKALLYTNVALTLTPRTPLTQYLTDNSDEAILYMKAIIMSMGYEGEEMQRLVVKFDKKNL